MKGIEKQEIGPLAIRLSISVGAGILMTLIVCVMVASLVSGGKVEESAMGYGVWAAVGMGSLVAAVVAVWGTTVNKLLASLASGVLYLLVLLCSTALLFGGQYQGVWVHTVLVLGVSVAVGLIKYRGKEQSYRRKYKLKLR